MTATSPVRPELTMNAWLRFDGIVRAFDDAAPTRVLEFGAGQGALGEWLASRYDYTGIEPDDSSRAVAQARLARRGRGRVLGALDDSVHDVDVVCAFEVLEHIEDDVAALKEWSTLLRPRGYLVASVPAHPKRFAATDRLAGHFRRYSAADMTSHLDAAGFEVVRLESYGAGLGRVLEWGRNRLAIRAGYADDLAERTAASGRFYQPTARWQTSLYWLVAAPFRALERPFARTEHGIGWVVLARLRA